MAHPVNVVGVSYTVAPAGIAGAQLRPQTPAPLVALPAHRRVGWIRSCPARSLSERVDVV